MRPALSTLTLLAAALQLAAQADVGLGRGIVTAELAIEQRHDPVLERLRLECIQALVIGAEGYHQIFRKDLAKRGGQGHTALGVYLVSVGAVHVDRLVDAFCHAFLPLLSACSVRCLRFYPTSSLRRILRHVLGGFAQALTPCNLPDSFVKQVFSGVVSIWCARWFANHNI